MEGLFIISMTRINSDWNLAVLDYDFCAFEYCEEVLDIPQESIYDTSLTPEGLKIILMEVKSVTHEDWYIQLERISRYELVA